MAIKYKNKTEELTKDLEKRDSGSSTFFASASLTECAKKNQELECENRDLKTRVKQLEEEKKTLESGMESAEQMKKVTRWYSTLF